MRRKVLWSAPSNSRVDTARFAATAMASSLQALGAAARPMLQRAVCSCSTVTGPATVTSSASIPSRLSLAQRAGYSTTSARSAAPHHAMSQPSSSASRRIPYRSPESTASTSSADGAESLSPITRALDRSKGEGSEERAKKLAERRATKMASSTSLARAQTGNSVPQQNGEGPTGFGASPQPQKTAAELLNDRWEKAAGSASSGSQHAATVAQSDSRSLPVGANDSFARVYRRLQSGVIAANNVRGELRLLERYEKPHYKAQRLRSALHRRRFALEIGQKVAAVMRAKRQGM